MAARLCSTALYSVQPRLWMHAGQPDIEQQSHPRISSSARRSSCGNSGRACNDAEVIFKCKIVTQKGSIKCNTMPVHCSTMQPM